MTITFDTRLGTFQTRDRDIMAEYLAKDYELETEAAIHKHVKPGMVCAVVGANIGFFARLICDIAGDVFCVEPHPENAEHLRANVPEAVVYEVAAGLEDGTTELHCHTHNSGDNRTFSSPQVGNPIEVQVRRLESLLPPLDFALFDCQGHDHLALCGLGQNAPPVALVEHWAQGLKWAGFDPEEVLDLYAGLGYSVTRLSHEDEWAPTLLLERDASVPVPPVDMEAV